MAFSFWKKMFGDQAQSGQAGSAVKAAEAAVSAEEKEEKVETPVKSEVVVDDVEVNVPVAEEDAVAEDTLKKGVSDSKVTKEGLEDFVAFVSRSLVDNPEAVQVSTLEKDRLSVIQIRCEKRDIGKIVGKNGKTIAAIRTLVSGAGGRIGLRMTVEVLD
ncbi:MAG: KH domain-containing protein [Victivallales bacterium]|nr:KH domain-containing protein [Victivallales bacterium]